jgi:hypothetical protein
MDKAIERGFHRKKVITCHANRMMAWYNLGATAFEAGDKAEGKRCLEKAKPDAELVLVESDDENEKKVAKDILDQIQKILGR